MQTQTVRKNFNLHSLYFSGVPEHWCQTYDSISSNCTEDQTKVLTIPTENKDGLLVYSQCQYFEYNDTQKYIDESMNFA